LIIHISESAKEDFTEEQYVQILQKAEGIPGAFSESYAKKNALRRITRALVKPIL